MPRDRRYYCAYIMGSLTGTLYIGTSGNLHRRVFQTQIPSLGRIHRPLQRRSLALLGVLRWRSQRSRAREKQLTGWSRAKKIALFAAGIPTGSILPASGIPGWRSHQNAGMLRLREGEQSDPPRV